MKPVRLRPAAKADMRRELAYLQREAGATVAKRLLKCLRQAESRLSAEPGIGSLRVGQVLDIAGLRAWPLDGFPMSLWYFERAEHVEIVRLVAHRQDRERIDIA